jgi:exopolyphosphatase / guanosine-5'-triphosphate,3'-diphosphate pyrophosphatase
MTRLAGIDCGTNTIRLLIADHRSGDPALTDRLRQARIVRLGQGVDRTGRLAPEAIERTRAVLAEYVAACRDDGVERIRMVATSATRDAENRDEFAAMVRATLGADSDVLTGAEEAQLSFTGAVRDVPDSPGPHLVADIGGGSTELVLGHDDRPGIAGAHSMDIGSVRLTERHLPGDPPGPDEVAAAEADIRAALAVAREDVAIERAGTLVAVAGTATTMAALALGLRTYDPARVHHSRIPADTVRALADRLLRATRAERAAEQVIQPGRVDVIGAGALILRVVVDESGVDEVIVSEHDILDGIVWSLVERG